MDIAKNFAKVTVSTGYNSTDTSIVLTAGHGAKLPTAPFNAVWWNATDYADPTDDPNVEIVRVTLISTDTLTVTREQEDITKTTKNTAGKTYKMIAGLTAKTINQDVAALSGANFTGNVDVNPSTAIVPVAPIPPLSVSKVTGTYPVPQTGTYFHIVGADSETVRMLVDAFGGTTPAAAMSFSFRCARGTSSIPSAVKSGDPILNLASIGYGTTAYVANSRAGIQTICAEDWTDAHRGMYMRFLTTPIGTDSIGETMRIADTGDITFSGKLISVSGVPTVNIGVGLVVATLDLTTHAANESAATLYAVPASQTGFYRVSGSISVTQAASSSSTMPSITLGWTHGDSSAAQAPPAVLTATSAGNSTTTTFAQFSYVVYAKASTNITYTTASYASSGGTPMQFALHMRVERV